MHFRWNSRGVGRRGPRRAVGVILAIVLISIVAGCGGFFYRTPSVVIADVRVVGLGLTSGTAEVELEVENPNFFQLEVHELEYVLEIEEREDHWTALARGSSDEEVRLPRRSTESVILTIPFDYEALGAALRSWWESGEVNYRLAGDLRGRGPAGGMEVPFRASGRMSD